MNFTQSLDFSTISSELKLMQDFVNAQNIKTILCDCFDTILVRKVHPEKVKKIMLARVRDAFDLKCTSAQLYQLRARLERELCQQSVVNGGDLEFSVEDLIEPFYQYVIAVYFI